MTSVKGFFISEKTHPKKSLGQNFIRDPRVLNRIGEIAGLSEEDEVLEIGAGLGALTLFLGKKVKRVMAIEKDIKLLEELKRTVSSLGNVEIIPGDALQVDFRGLYRGREIKVVSNLPYSVSSPILVKLIEEREIFALFILMLQREVGERITASPGKKDYGSISVLVQAYTNASIELHVSPAAFWPQPKVDSVVVKLIPLSTPRIRLQNEKLFRKIIRAAFSSRRKIISNSLGSQFPKGKVEEVLLRSGIDKKRRAETLSVEEFGRVAEEAAKVGL